jgi:hypothetical protein
VLFGEIVQMRTARLILDQDPIAPSEPLDQFGFSNLDLSQF